jgi:hypothetical protein
MSATQAKNFYVESGASDGVTPATTRVLVTIPAGYRKFRFCAFNGTTRALVTCELGIFDGTNKWQMVASVTGVTQGTQEYLAPRVPPGVAVPLGVRQVYVEPQVALTAGQRLEVSVLFSAD